MLYENRAIFPDKDKHIKEKNYSLPKVGFVYIKFLPLGPLIGTTFEILRKHVKYALFKIF